MRRRDGSRGRRQHPNFEQNQQPPTGYRQQAQPPVQYVMVPVPVESMPYLTGQQPMSQQFHGQPPFNYALPQPTPNYQPPTRRPFTNSQPTNQQSYHRGSRGNLNILGDSSDTEDQTPRKPSNRSRTANRRQQYYTEEVDVDENDVFTFLLKRFSGACTFEEFLRNCDFFPSMSSISSWFSKHGRRFNIYRDGGNIVYISVFYKEMKICKNYIRPPSCKRSNCNFFHVCRKFVRGNCKNRDCQFSHSFKTTVNRQIKEKLGIDHFTDADITIILNSNSPAVCPDYIYENGCKLQDSEKRCPYLHLCRYYIFGKCKQPCKHKMTHSIEQFHNKWVLTSCHMKGWAETDVLKEIIVPPRKGKDKPDDSDPSDDDDDDDDVYLGSDFISDEDEVQSGNEGENISSSMAYSFEKLHVADDHSLEQTKSQGKGSRKNRFFAGNTFENDKSPKLPVDDAIHNRHWNYEDDLDIKEKERLLMEEWNRNLAAKSSTERAKRNFLQQGAVSVDDRAAAQTHRHELDTMTSRRSSSKPLLTQTSEPGTMASGRISSGRLFTQKSEPGTMAPGRSYSGHPLTSRSLIDEMTNAHYQEITKELLQDDSDQKHICIFVTKSRCMSSQCPNHHLESGLPYLWQIQLFGEWLSFTTGENIMIEKCFCDLLSIADTEILVDFCPYKIHVIFDADNKMYGVIYDIDGDGNQGLGDSRLAVRRLSIPSYVEDITCHRYYATQWRWYFDGDSWVMYDENTQIKLERNYLSKQSTVDCRSRYTIMFDRMEQINNATQTIRQILRRPLFVSLTDIMDGKFPKQILSDNI